MLDGRPLMGIGCPGGDVQTQGMLQVFLNMVHFGMNPQQAIEAPRLLSFNFPNSFAPHAYHPGRVDVESRIAGEVRGELVNREHSVNVARAWEPLASSVHVGLINPVNGILLGGADPRREGSAIGW
jgi:gamma-glutamyltranspeptidase/glutathione hydrolase